MTTTLLILILGIIIFILYHLSKKETFDDIVIRNPETKITSIIPVKGPSPKTTSLIAAQATIPLTDPIRSYKKMSSHQLGDCSNDYLPEDVKSLLISDIAHAELTKQNRNNLADFGKIINQGTYDVNVVDKIAEIRTDGNPTNALKSNGKKISEVYNKLVDNNIHHQNDILNYEGFDGMMDDYANY